MARKIRFIPTTEYIMAVIEGGNPAVVTMRREDYRFTRISPHLMWADPITPDATDIGRFGWVDVIDPLTADNDALFTTMWAMFEPVPPGWATEAKQDDIIAKMLNELVSTPVTDLSLSEVSKSILYAKMDDGSYAAIKGTLEGHIEAAIHAPTLPYRSIHAEAMHPVFQSDAVYGINSRMVLPTTSLSGTVTAADSMFVLQTGATIFSQAVLQGRTRLRARPGQGGICRFEARFDTPVAFSYQVAGLGHAEDGVFIGYRDISGAVPEIGVLYVNRGVREVQTLTVTVASSTTENVTVTLAGVAFLVAVTNSGNIQRTVYEISRGTFAGWAAEPVGATVVFVAESVGNKAGAFTLAGTTVAGTFAETKAGAASTEAYVPQSSWNGDKLDGTGPSGVTLDPQKLNGYEIQCHGPAGPVIFKANLALTGNDHDTVAMHTIAFENSRDNPAFGNPSFPFTAAAYSAGSSSNITVRIGTLSGFLEGRRVVHGTGFSMSRSLAATVDTAAYWAFFTIRNTRYFAGRANQSVVTLQSIAVSLNHTQPVVFHVIKGGTLVGNPAFASHSASCCTMVDVAATQVAIATDDQIIYSNHLTNDGNVSYSLINEGISLQPGEYLTFAARAIQGTAADATMSINWQEDQ